MDDSLSFSSSDDIYNPHQLYELYASSSSSSLFFNNSDSSNMYDSESSSSSSSNERKDRSSKTTYTVNDRINSLFYKQYILRGRNDQLDQESSIHNPMSWIGKKFRRRFSIPFDLFQSILGNMKELGIFAGKKCTGEIGILPELLVLACFRVISSGCTFDAVEELTCVHEETIRVFYEQVFTVGLY